jgi:hypothetical protein
LAALVEGRLPRRVVTGSDLAVAKTALEARVEEARVEEAWPECRKRRF